MFVLIIFAPKHHLQKEGIEDAEQRQCHVVINKISEDNAVRSGEIKYVSVKVINYINVEPQGARHGRRIGFDNESADIQLPPRIPWPEQKHTHGSHVLLQFYKNYCQILKSRSNKKGKTRFCSNNRRITHELIVSFKFNKSFLSYEKYYEIH